VGASAAQYPWTFRGGGRARAPGRGRRHCGTRISGGWAGSAASSRPPQPPGGGFLPLSPSSPAADRSPEQSSKVRPPLPEAAVDPNRFRAPILPLGRVRLCSTHLAWGSLSLGQKERRRRVRGCRSSCGIRQPIKVLGRISRSSRKHPGSSSMVSANEALSFALVRPSPQLARVKASRQFELRAVWESAMFSLPQAFPLLPPENSSWRRWQQLTQGLAGASRLERSGDAPTRC